MSEPDNPNPSFPALEQARHLSDLLREGGPEDLTPSPEEEEAAYQLQQELVHRLRTVHHSQWPRPELKRRTAPEQQEPAEELRITAP